MPDEREFLVGGETEDTVFEQSELERPLPIEDIREAQFPGVRESSDLEPSDSESDLSEWAIRAPDWLVVDCRV